MLELIVNISFVKCFFLFYSYVQGTGGYFSHQIILMLMESGKQKFPPLITFLPDHFAISKYEGRVSWGLLILSFSWISRKPFLFHVIKASFYLLLSLFNRVFFYGGMFSLSIVVPPLPPHFILVYLLPIHLLLQNARTTTFVLSNDDSKEFSFLFFVFFSLCTWVWPILLYLVLCFISF